MTAPKFITVEEVNKNNGKNGTKIWVIIKNNIYDVTEYLDKHPGGRDLLEEYAGKDATKAFNDIGHSAEAESILKTFKIGEIPEAERNKTQNKKKSVPAADKPDSSHVNRTFIATITCGLLR